MTNEFSRRDHYWMEQALALAARAAEQGEVPVGAVVVRDNLQLSEGWNRTIGDSDPSAHAEVVALRAAGQALGNYRMPGCVMYVTLEPCGMCISTVLHARLERLVFAAPDPKTGALGGAWDLPSCHRHNHSTVVEGGLLADEAANQLRTFFRSRR